MVLEFAVVPHFGRVERGKAADSAMETFDAEMSGDVAPQRLDGARARATLTAAQVPNIAQTADLREDQLVLLRRTRGAQRAAGL